LTPEPTKFDNLSYAPNYGCVELPGAKKSWSVEVSIEQGRAMEEDGFVVLWVHSAIPEWVPGPLVSIWVGLNRFFTWPNRWVNGGQK